MRYRPWRFFSSARVAVANSGMSNTVMPPAATNTEAVSASMAPVVVAMEVTATMSGSAMVQ